MDHEYVCKVLDQKPICYPADELAKKVEKASNDGEALSFLLSQLVSFGYDKAVSMYARRMGNSEQDR